MWPIRKAALLWTLAACWLQAAPLKTILVDYPADGSIFPPEITAPTFLWRDTASGATGWRIDISFADGQPALHAAAPGLRMRVGPIDPDCVADTNEPPRLTPEQAAARTWKPGANLWAAIKRRSAAGPAAVTITGLAGSRPVSQGRVRIWTSKDPAGAPIFYRDVPLMPSETQTGEIKPLAAEAVRLIAWRVRNLAEPASRVAMANVPLCANCHSFSADGKTLGMDLDGLARNKGQYTLTPVGRDTSIRPENVIQWKSSSGKLDGKLRVGFMSQVSPHGRYVVTTIDSEQPAATSNYYVANFKDYRFLQVFYPTRGVLAWYSRETGILTPLPGADDPRLVQTNAVWSPDGSYLVFARAEAQEPNPKGVPVARFANDPHERQVRYDLYRIPFNGGKGGRAEPVRGASANGMSNTFPKVSPDGRWIVFVRCRNGLLMRPDSELYIVPAGGGEARRMHANTRLMNSWHSFSPNGRWLVFSSKSRSPYTQMYLTHIDEDGNDSPAILVENTTAANRAVNLPEFVNVAPGGFEKLGGPAVDYYRWFDRALYLQKAGRYEESVTAWQKVLEIRPEDAMAHNNLGMVLALAGRREEAGMHLQKAAEARLREAVEAEPARAAPHNNLGKALLEAGKPEEAAAEFEKALAIDPSFSPARVNLAAARAGLFSRRGQTEEAAAEWRKVIEFDPKHAEAQAALGDLLAAQGKTAEALSHWRTSLEVRPGHAATLRKAAWALATSPDPAVRDGKEAVALAVRAVQLPGGRNAAGLDTLAAAYAAAGRYQDAATAAYLALDSARGDQAAAIRQRIALYEAGKPYREAR